jgi:hypothetical protein
VLLLHVSIESGIAEVSLVTVLALVVSSVDIVLRATLAAFVLAVLGRAIVVRVASLLSRTLWGRRIHLAEIGFLPCQKARGLLVQPREACRFRHLQVSRRHPSHTRHKSGVH